ncbi:MAG: FAD binding domain-containing protein [Minwuia sp.]|uniref:FAD binding domain-containing protein n=1 Tax=Minwuia sp. TaxID=2493630 RepID=UPI003A8512A3
MKTFAYHRPGSVAEAVALLGGSEDARIFAGGMTLLPTMKQRLVEPSDLIDLTAIPELTGITAGGGTVKVGAMAKHGAVATSEEVIGAIPALSSLAAGIGDPQVRNRGTIGGSIANADPAADYPAAVVGLGATVTTDRREIAGDAFFTGLFETALEDDEVIVSISFPVPEAAAYLKMANPASRYAIVGVFVARFPDCVRIAVTGAAASAFRATAMEQALDERFEPTALDGVRISPDGFNSDIHADAAYRANLVRVLARRAVMAIQTAAS